ncbi:MAG: hypothetical protein WCY19_05020 [Candidatus Gastranaerophilaceae bacterium]
MTGIFLDIDQSKLDDIVKNFDASKKVLDEAGKKAISKTVNWIRQTALVEIEAKTKVPKAVLSSRAKVYLDKDKAWFGAYRINFIRLGAKQVAGGVQAGSIFIPGAFIAKLRDGASEGVYKRKGKAKFPVVGFKKVIAQDVENVVKNDILNKVNDKLLENLKEELSEWEINKNS